MIHILPRQVEEPFRQPMYVKVRPMSDGSTPTRCMYVYQDQHHGISRGHPIYVAMPPCTT